MKPWTTRPARPDDLAFIVDSWVRSYRDSRYAGTVRNDEYNRVQRSTIAGLLGRGARVIVAVEPTTERLLGFLCFEPPSTLHYTYVKRAFRGLGVAGSLLDSSGLTVPGVLSHRTGSCAPLLARGWTWDPVAARKEKLG